MFLDVEKATRELNLKTIEDIQRETALTWASRAAAAYALYGNTQNPRWLLDAEEYYHEALEHAILASPQFAFNIQAMLGGIRKQMRP